MHPYIPYRVVPNPPSRVSSQASETLLTAALDRHLARVSQRNKALTPADIYERVKAQKPR